MKLIRLGNRIINLDQVTDVDLDDGSANYRRMPRITLFFSYMIYEEQGSISYDFDEPAYEPLFAYLIDNCVDIQKQLPNYEE